MRGNANRWEDVWVGAEGNERDQGQQDQRRGSGEAETGERSCWQMRKPGPREGVLGTVEGAR